jgi:hypothetical protein
MTKPIYGTLNREIKRLMQRRNLMNKTYLESLFSSHVACRRLAYEIKQLDRASDCVSDIVRGSRDIIPYDMHNVSISGYGSDKFPRKYAKYYDKLGVLNRKIEETENWIEQLDDEEMKSIFSLRYCRGLYWHEVAAILYPDENHDESYPRQKVDNFFKSLCLGNKTEIEP